jgi:hypothetical protein
LRTTLSPNLGILYEKTKASELQDRKIDLTGGTILRASLGVEVGLDKITVGFDTQLPVAQNFAEDQTRSRIKGMAHITFAF